ncbi:ricin-type beta-trefoil lectin domain protein [Streptomyces sp. NPDC127039]|uniref:RICIN domain-containing protein n=1 Tax=Streptomyces sp. NPDC127039 TaxID=3347115 RepID=UPI003662A305
MRLVRTLAALLTAVLASALMLTGTANAAPAPGAASTGVVTSTGAAAKGMYFQGTAFGFSPEMAEANAFGFLAQKAKEARYHQCVPAAPTRFRPTSGGYLATAVLLCQPMPPIVGGPIVGVHSGKCMDVKGASRKDGAPIQLYTCNGTEAQAWTIHKDGTIRAMGRCLDVQYAKTENGSLLGLNTCHGAANQRWEKLPNGLLRSVHSGKCLDALGWQTGNGARLGIWTCAPSHTNQQWKGAGMNT